MRTCPPEEHAKLGNPVGRRTARASATLDNDLTPDGIAQLKLQEGLAGKASIQLKGKGVFLDEPVYPLAQPLTAQLVNSLGVCWQAVYSAPATINAAGPPGQFKDKDAPP